MKESYKYDKSSLKISTDTDMRNEPYVEEKEIQKKKEEMSNRKAFAVIVMLIAMFAIVSAIPTFILMYFFDVGFWFSQLVVFIGTVIIVLLFGLHKPASNEQKLKSKFLL